MLVLTRRMNDVIYIGANKEIIAKVLRIRGGKVRLGIQAPKDVRIHAESCNTPVLKQRRAQHAE